MLPKIVINARFLTQPITGVQRFAVEICKELQKKNENIVFVCPSNILHKDIAQLLKVKVIGYNTGHLWEKIDLPVYLRLHGNPLLINLCNTSPLFYSNQIVTIHDMAVFENPSWFTKKFVLLYKFVYPLMVLNSKKVLTVSEFSRKEIQKYLNVKIDKIEVIYNSVDHCRVFTGESQNKYGKYILCVGSVEPRKNLKNLIKAFDLASLPDDYNLVIVGGKNKLFNSLPLDDSPKLLDKVIFTGYVSDEELSYLYQHAKVFVYPSLYEGFGIPPLEAMFYGCPTIISNTSSLPEVCGDASLYINPYHTQSIVTQIEHLLSNKDTRDKLVADGYKQVLKYSWKESGMKLYKLVSK